MMSGVAVFSSQPTRWHPGFNDPTIIGWASVVGYFLAAALAARAVTRARRGGSPFDRRFWIAIAFAMVMLGINKQLDLHVLVTDIGRDWARGSGFYESRRILQKAFMLAVAAGLGIALIAGIHITRRRAAPVRLALAGLAMSIGYILIRAASFHHTDQLMRTTMFGLRWNWLIEVAGFTLVALSARRYRAIAAFPFGRKGQVQSHQRP